MNTTYPPEHPFGHLVRSNTPENIYYADLFRINSHNWMILGSGKTYAAQVASHQKRDAMHATDAVALIRGGHALWGRYDPGAVSTKNPELSTLYRLDAIAYCLDEEQTAEFFKARGAALAIADVGFALIAGLCATYAYPAYMAPHFFSEQELSHFSNPIRMTQRFAELTQGAVGTKFLIVPFMPSVEEKAALYSGFVF